LPFSGLFKSQQVTIKNKKKGNETQVSAKAKQDQKLVKECKGEFFGALDFLVTFLAMKKVT
jgi:hypothetical protein